MGLGAEQAAEQLRSQLAISMRLSWVQECLAFLKAKHASNFDSWTDEQTLQAVFGQFLLCDMNLAGQGGLPAGASDMHKTTLQGRFVLQVDEVVNMAAPARDRYTSGSDGNSRMLKLHMTDGVQRIMGVEYQPIKTLGWESEGGVKVMVHDVPMRKGVMLLRPHNIVVLGGQVERLETARQQAVACWNQPPGGRRHTDPPRDIFGEARAAAWQQRPPQAAPGTTGPAQAGPGMQGPAQAGQGMQGPAQAGQGMQGPAQAGPGMQRPAEAGPGMQHDPGPAVQRHVQAGVASIGPMPGPGPPLHGQDQPAAAIGPTIVLPGRTMQHPMAAAPPAACQDFRQQPAAQLALGTGSAVQGVGPAVPVPYPAAGTVAPAWARVQAAGEQGAVLPAGAAASTTHDPAAGRLATNGPCAWHGAQLQAHGQAVQQQQHAAHVRQPGQTRDQHAWPQQAQGVQQQLSCQGRGWQRQQGQGEQSDQGLGELQQGWQGHPHQQQARQGEQHDRQGTAPARQGLPLQQTLAGAPPDLIPGSATAGAAAIGVTASRAGHEDAIIIMSGREGHLQGPVAAAAPPSRLSSRPLSSHLQAGRLWPAQQQGAAAELGEDVSAVGIAKDFAGRPVSLEVVCDSGPSHELGRDQGHGSVLCSDAETAVPALGGGQQRMALGAPVVPAAAGGRSGIGSATACSVFEAGPLAAPAKDDNCSDLDDFGPDKQPPASLKQRTGSAGSDSDFDEDECLRALHARASLGAKRGRRRSRSTAKVSVPVSGKRRRVDIVTASPLQLSEQDRQDDAPAAKQDAAAAGTATPATYAAVNAVHVSLDAHGKENEPPKPCLNALVAIQQLDLGGAPHPACSAVAPGTCGAAAAASPGTYGAAAAVAPGTCGAAAAAAPGTYSAAAAAAPGTYGAAAAAPGTYDAAAAAPGTYGGADTVRPTAVGASGPTGAGPSAAGTDGSMAAGVATGCAWGGTAAHHQEGHPEERCWQGDDGDQNGGWPEDCQQQEEDWQDYEQHQQDWQAEVQAQEWEQQLPQQHVSPPERQQQQQIKVEAIEPRRWEVKEEAVEHWGKVEAEEHHVKVEAGKVEATEQQGWHRQGQLQVKPQDWQQQLQQRQLRAHGLQEAQVDTPSQRLRRGRPQLWPIGQQLEQQQQQQPQRQQQQREQRQAPVEVIEIDDNSPLPPAAARSALGSVPAILVAQRAPSAAISARRPPFMRLAKVQSELQPSRRPWQAVVSATFYKTIDDGEGNKLFLLEDGTGIVAATMSDEAQMSLFDGYTLQRMHAEAQSDDPAVQQHATSLAATFGLRLPAFWGAMELHGQGSSVSVMRLLPFHSPADMQQLMSS